jgi:hypothetical protein
MAMPARSTSHFGSSKSCARRACRSCQNRSGALRSVGVAPDGRLRARAFGRIARACGRDRSTGRPHSARARPPSTPRAYEADTPLISGGIKLPPPPPLIGDPKSVPPFGPPLKLKKFHSEGYVPRVVPTSVAAKRGETEEGLVPCGSSSGAHFAKLPGGRSPLPFARA